MANVEVDSKQSKRDSLDSDVSTKVVLPLIRITSLLILTVILSFVAPLLAPAPLILISLFFGRKWGVLIGFLYLIITIGILQMGGKFPAGTQSGAGQDISLGMMAILFGIFVFYMLIAEIINRNISPTRGFFVVGWVLFLVFGIGIVSYEIMNQGVIEQGLHKIISETIVELKKQQSAGVKFFGFLENAILDFEKSPDLIVGQIYKSLPGALFAYIFLGLWLNLALVLGLDHVWKGANSRTGRINKFQFSLQDLAKFKTPDHFVWLLILALIGVLAGDAFTSQMVEFASLNVLLCLGVLYFFQGFGVYYEFLTFIKIEGFLKFAFIVFTVTALAQGVAIVGAFDMWFDFRRFFVKNKKDEGDFI